MGLGTVAGKPVSIEPLDWAYSGSLQLLGDPGAQVPSLTAAVALSASSCCPPAEPPGWAGGRRLTRSGSISRRALPSRCSGR